ncbi:hypothetical protein NC652_022430 [Populus alba x Populus x berolinensis]|nr:hypothetical protein NC652_022430 [Populus alba x Populus x berolinensis]
MYIHLGIWDGSYVIAVSLTGEPCICTRDTMSILVFSATTIWDPFDFESANVSSATVSGFSPLQQRKQHPSISEKGSRKKLGRDDRSVDQVHPKVVQGSHKSEDMSTCSRNFKWIWLLMVA